MLRTDSVDQPRGYGGDRHGSDTGDLVILRTSSALASVRFLYLADYLSSPVILTESMPTTSSRAVLANANVMDFRLLSIVYSKS